MPDVATEDLLSGYTGLSMPDYPQPVFYTRIMLNRYIQQIAYWLQGIIIV